MRITSRHLKQIIREELIRVDEGLLDKIAGYFGGGKSREEEAAEHFTTVNPIWPKMQAKLKRDKGVRTTVQKNLGALTGADPNEAYDKYIPSEWQNSREDIRTYRKAMSKVMLDYISELRSAEESEAEEKRQEREELEQEKEFVNRYLADRNVTESVMGHFGMGSDLRRQVSNLCSYVFLNKYFRHGIKNPLSSDVIDDAVALIDQARIDLEAKRVDSSVISRATAHVESLKPERPSPSGFFPWRPPPRY